MPPDSGNLGIDSDTEEYPEQLNVEDNFFEPSGELEIGGSESDNCSNDETVLPKKNQEMAIHTDEKIAYSLKKFQLQQPTIYLTFFLI